MENQTLAVLIPCYNEGQTVAKVVESFKYALPNANIYVYDNASTDDTKAQAERAGAIVRIEPRKGKGNVVRRMFNDIEADIYIMVDGDNTYDASFAPQMVKKLQTENLDMLVGARKPIAENAYRIFHQWGNLLFNRVVSFLFGRQFVDIFSGYRVFSRRFVKSFPCHASGFEIETEITVHALEMHLPVAEISTPYGARPPGSFSKLGTFKDGFRIFCTIFKLLKDVKPLLFFGIIFGILLIISLALFMPIWLTYLETGLVPRFPTAFLVASLMILAFLSLFLGIILDSISRARLENKRLLYLAVHS